MPGSSSVGKDIISELFVKNSSEINNILDVGPGWGTYFKLLNYCKPLNWECVEIWEPYIYRFKLYKKYSKIYVENILNFKPKRSYDLAILGDVLEHLDEKEAINVLLKVRKYSKFYLVSIPLDAETGAGVGTGDIDWKNPFEVHKGYWSEKKILELPFSKEILVSYKKDGMGVFIGKSEIFDPLFSEQEPTQEYIAKSKFLKSLRFSFPNFVYFIRMLIPSEIKQIIKKLIDR